MTKAFYGIYKDIAVISETDDIPFLLEFCTAELERIDKVNRNFQ